MMELDTITCADALDFLATLPDDSINCCVTSPPYWGLRDYGIDGQIGLEDTPQAFVQRMVTLFREVRRVLRSDGTCWVNLGDSYAGSGKGPTGYNGIGNQEKRQGFHSPILSIPNGLKPKDLCGIPWRVALALQDDGWWLRSDIIWHKPNPMPESVTDRPTKAHEYIFLLTKSASYWYDADAIREEHKPESIQRYEYGLNTSAPSDGYVNAGANNPRAIGHAKKLKDNINPAGRNKRTVWTVATQPTPMAHFATYPLALIDPCVKAGCPPQVCVECGAPWVRVVEREKPPESVFTNTSKPESISAIGNGKVGMGQKLQKWLDAHPTITIGWQPTCDCNASTRPGIVYDPFMGAGTTALVSIQNNRHYIGSELNPDYVAMANQRIAEFDPFQPSDVGDGMTQLSLFDPQTDA